MEIMISLVISSSSLISFTIPNKCLGIVVAFSLFFYGIEKKRTRHEHFVTQHTLRHRKIHTHKGKEVSKAERKRTTEFCIHFSEIFKCTVAIAQAAPPAASKVQAAVRQAYNISICIHSFKIYVVCERF